MQIEQFSATYPAANLPPAFYAIPQGTPLHPQSPTMRHAQAHLLIRTPENQSLARASLWWQNTAPFQRQPTGYIGHYAIDPACHPTAAGAAAKQLLDAACDELARHGCAWAIGPLDGSTFHNYRFVTQRTGEESIRGESPEDWALSNVEENSDGEQERANPPAAAPPFFLEPQNPDAWPLQFEQNQFVPIARYCSARGVLLPQDPALDLLHSRAQAAGGTLRPVDLSRFTQELEQIHTVVSEGFQHNFLYTPQERAEFIAQYQPLQAHIHPQLAWVAEKHDRIVGFIFALPDLAQAQRGETVDTIIIKTVAVHPQSGLLGLGSLLVAQCQQAAYGLGYRRVIHALMHEDNISTKISRRYAQPMRRYTLYARALEDRAK